MKRIRVETIYYEQTHFRQGTTPRRFDTATTALAADLMFLLKELDMKAAVPLCDDAEYERLARVVIYNKGLRDSLREVLDQADDYQTETEVEPQT